MFRFKFYVIASVVFCLLSAQNAQALIGENVFTLLNVKEVQDVTKETVLLEVKGYVFTFTPKTHSYGTENIEISKKSNSEILAYIILDKDSKTIDEFRIAYLKMFEFESAINDLSNIAIIQNIKEDLGKNYFEDQRKRQPVKPNEDSLENSMKGLEESANALVNEKIHINNYLPHRRELRIFSKKAGQLASVQISNAFKPIHRKLPFDDEQIRIQDKEWNDWANNTFEINSINLNVDFGLIEIINNTLMDTVIAPNDEPSFIFIDHGHSPAALIPFIEKMDSSRTEFLFDTTVLFPMNDWDSDHPKIGVVKNSVFWADRMKEGKWYQKIFQKKARGVAIALNGHRNDFRWTGDNKWAKASINFEKELGTPDQFLKMLASRHLTRIVVLMEGHIDNNPDKINKVNMYRLNLDSHDLVSYLKKIQLRAKETKQDISVSIYLADPREEAK